MGPWEPRATFLPEQACRFWAQPPGEATGVGAGLREGCPSPTPAPRDPQ